MITHDNDVLRMYCTYIQHKKQARGGLNADCRIFPIGHFSEKKNRGFSERLTCQIVKWHACMCLVASVVVVLLITNG